MKNLLTGSKIYNQKVDYIFVPNIIFIYRNNNLEDKSRMLSLGHHCFI